MAHARPASERDALEPHSATVVLTRLTFALELRANAGFADGIVVIAEQVGLAEQSRFCTVDVADAASAEPGAYRCDAAVRTRIAQ